MDRESGGGGGEREREEKIKRERIWTERVSK